jgi:hypothetical protein
MAQPGRSHPVDPRLFFPLTFSERRVRIQRYHGQEKIAYRRVSRLISLNPDPRTLGEVLLRGIKESA